MTHAYSSDHPISTGEEDLLNRAAFAERIADILASVPDGDNLVVGLHGPWGNGKTSVLNLVRKRLQEKTSIVIKDFNPWRLSDEEKIIRGFITLLASALGQSLETKSEGRWRLARKYLKFGSAAADKIPVYGPTVAAVLKGLDQVAKTGDDVILEDLRSRLITVLTSATKKVVILIDDIDRLDCDEIHILFKLIKACADLPNVSYLMAFDDLAVANTLRRRYSEDAGGDAGRAFLEKIIQVPLTLPHAQPADLRLICLQDLQRVLEETETTLSKEEVTRFVTHFDRSFLHRIANPRVGKRYANSLRFALPMLRDEVNTVDLLLIEAVRSFFPEVFDIIKENQGLFHGVERSSSAGGPGIEAVEIMKSYMDLIEPRHQVPIQAILVELFPRLAPGYSRGGFRSSEWLESYAKEKRICSPEYCPRYFSYSVPRSDVADAVIMQLIAAAIDKRERDLDFYMDRNLEPGKARTFISKLRFIEETIDPRAVRPICIAIATRAHLLPNISGFMNFDNPPMQAGILISHLIRQIEDVEDRLKVAIEVIQKSEPLWFASEALRWLNVTDDPEKSHQNTLSIDQIKSLKTQLIVRIKAASVRGIPMFDPEVSQEGYLLTEWVQNEGREPVQRHLQAIFEKDTSQVVRFLEAMASRSWSVMDGLPSPPEIMGDHVNQIESLIDLETMAQIVMGTCHGDFINPKLHPDPTLPTADRLAEQFIYLVKKRGSSSKS